MKYQALVGFLLRAASVAIVVAAVAVGCGRATDGGGSWAVGVDPVLIAAPRGGVVDMPAWLPSAGRLTVAYVPPGGDPTPAWRNHLYWFDLKQGTLQRLPLPDRTGCSATSQDVGRALPDGRVSYLEQCWGPNAPRKPKRLRSYDSRTGAIRDVRPYALPFGANHYAFAPDGRRGIINDGNGLYERLHWLGDAGLVPLDVDFERAGYPAWSHDGRSIAVDAVPANAEASGIARVDLQRNLYLLRGDGSIRRTLVSDVANAGASSWSPDDRWLALPLNPRDGPPGLYLIDAASGKLRLLREGDDFGGSVWLDRRTLLVATGLFVQIEPGDRRSGLYRIEIEATSG